jgi:hypothetical protein
MMCVKQPVKWKLAGETEVLGKKPAPEPLFAPQIPHLDLGLNPGRPGGKPETIRLSYGAAFSSDVSLGDKVGFVL